MLLFHSHCELDLYPIEPKIDMEHLLSMNNVYMKFGKAGQNQTLVIDWTKVVYYRRSEQTNQQTDRYKAIYPLFFQGGHNEGMCKP